MGKTATRVSEVEPGAAVASCLGAPASRLRRQWDGPLSVVEALRQPLQSSLQVPAPLIGLTGLLWSVHDGFHELWRPQPPWAPLSRPAVDGGGDAMTGGLQLGRFARRSQVCGSSSASSI